MAVAVTALRDHRPNAAAPIVAYGDGAVLRVPEHVAAVGARRVLLVCGRRSFDASGAGAILPELEGVADVLRWSEFDPNTDSADVRRGLAVMRAFKPDLVLGVGGGSAMDVAKLLCAFRDVPDERVLDSIRAGHPTDTRRQKLFLVPTTSGSGAEATHFAVVYIGHDKYSIGGEGIRPDAIALDPSLSVSGSAYQRATSAIDAVCQAIESMWATGATDRSRHFARVALRTLLLAIESFVNGHDRESARAMCIGSHFAGRAIDISRTTAAHALSYGITKTYGISHGHAVAMTLGSFIEAHAEATPDKLRDEVDPATHATAMAEVLFALRADSGADAGRRFVKLMESIGLNPSLAAVGAGTSAERRRLAAAVNAERLANNPVAFGQRQLADIVDAME